jgi:hypothetical protein
MLSRSPNSPAQLPCGLADEWQAHFPPLAGCPIGAQYGVYTPTRSNNSATLSRRVTIAEITYVQRQIMFLLVAALLGATAGQAAELPSQRHSDKPSHAEALKKCNVAGSPGVLAGNGVCVRLSGYVAAQFGAGQLR